MSDVVKDQAEEATVDDSVEAESEVKSEEVEPEKVPEIPEVADVVAVATPSDDIGKAIFKEVAMQAKQVLVVAQQNVEKTQAMADNPDIPTVDQTNVETAQEAVEVAQKRLDVILAAQGIDERTLLNDTISALANQIAQAQSFIEQWTATRRRHTLMADSPEAFGHNSLDLEWVKSNRAAAADNDAAIAQQEGLIAQWKEQQAALHKEKKS